MQDAKLVKLESRFRAESPHNNDEINEDGLRRLLLDFEIDDSFVSPMLRIIGGWKQSNTITIKEFVDFFNIIQEKDMQKFRKLLFRAFDKDSDGKISVNDIKDFSKIMSDEISEEEALQIIDAFDINGKGYFDMEDFMNLFDE